MTATTDSLPSDAEVKRYALGRLLAHLSGEETERLKPCLRDHQGADRPEELPVPEEGRAEASAFLVHYLVGATRQIRDHFADQEAESLRRLWRRHARDYAAMVADDLRTMWEEGTVHQPDFYGLKAPEVDHG